MLLKGLEDEKEMQARKEKAESEGMSSKIIIRTKKILKIHFILKVDITNIRWFVLSYSSISIESYLLCFQYIHRRCVVRLSQTLAPSEAQFRGKLLEVPCWI